MGETHIIGDLMKNRKTYNLSAELTANQYHQLLKFAADYCDTFQLVVRNSIVLSDKAKTFLDNLSPFLQAKTDVSEWQGTKLLDGSIAELYCFRLSTETISLLNNTAYGLFSWVQPELPEDLCLVRSDAEPFLVSIAHERDAYLILSFEEKILLENKISNLLLTEQSFDN